MNRPRFLSATHPTSPSLGPLLTRSAQASRMNRSLIAGESRVSTILDSEPRTGTSTIYCQNLWILVFAGSESMRPRSAGGCVCFLVPADNLQVVYFLERPDTPCFHRLRGFSNRTAAAMFVAAVTNHLLSSLDTRA